MTWRASHAAPLCVQGRKDARVSEDGSEDPAGDYLHVETGKQIKWEDSTKLIHQHILPHTLSLSFSPSLSISFSLSPSLFLSYPAPGVALSTKEKIIISWNF